MTPAIYLLGLVVAAGVLYALSQCVAISLEKTLAEQFRAVWKQPVIRIKVGGK